MLNKISAHQWEAGTDEAGRGCLAGPVTAAAVILPAGFSHPLINDSKKLTEKKRFELKPLIESQAISFGVIHVSAEEIDQINILNASITGMHRALDQLQPHPQYIAVDGNRFHPYREIPYQTVVKGDGKYLHIAAASILAKTYRDQLMDLLHLEYPMYQWNKNKGYPTPEHRDAIRKYGLSPYHRKSFRALPDQLKLDL